MFWECYETEACELFTKGLPRRVSQQHSIKRMDLENGAKIRRDKCSLGEDFTDYCLDAKLSAFELWNELVALTGAEV
jgi:hypothetical protein